MNSTSTNANAEKAHVGAVEKIIKFLDGGSFVELSSLSKCGVATGYGSNEGRLVYVYAQYGAVNQYHAEKISRLYDLASKMGAPVVGFLDSKGIELDDGLASLHAYGKIFAAMSDSNGVVPQITVILGECAGTSAFIPAISDFVIMPETAALLMLDSPNAIKDPKAKTATLQSAASGKAHAETTGLAHFTAKDENGCIEILKELLPFLPSNNLDEAPIGMFVDDLNRTDESLSEACGIQSIMASISDNNQFFESGKSYCTNIITAFARFNGYSTGIVANNGALCPDAVEKAISFISFCDAFNIPILTLTSASGYNYELSQQKNIIKSGARMLYAFSSATVPKVNVICGKASGSPYLMMNSKHIGADITYAWNNSGISLLQPEAALAVTGTKIDASPKVAAALGYVDNIIEPSVTRKMVIAALEMLNSKRVVKNAKKHGSSII